MCFKLLAYASRFLKYNNSLGISSHPYAVQTRERVSVSSDVDMSWDELHTEVWAKLPFKYLVNVLLLMLVTHLSHSFSLHHLYIGTDMLVLSNVVVDSHWMMLLIYWMTYLWIWANSFT